MTKNNDLINTILFFPCDVERLENGNTLICDAGNEEGLGSKVIEVDPSGNIIWNYNRGLKFAHGAKRLKNGSTLISDTTNNRIIEVTKDYEIIFSTDDWGGGTGLLSDGSHLSYPNDAHLVGDNFIITDRNNSRCIITDKQGNVIWFFDGVMHPHNCDMIDSGNVIIADSDAKRIIEVNMDKEIVWMYQGEQGSPLDWPRDADRLDNGNTLITDSRNSRVIEVNSSGDIVWSYIVNYFANFYDADKLLNGNILVSDQQHHQIIEVDRYGNEVWSFRNFRNLNTINKRVINGAFKLRDENNNPENWMLFSRFSEGGGRVIWEEGERPAIGLEFDRPGALCLQQIVGVKPGQYIKLAGRLRTEDIVEDGFAYLQLAFQDKYGGLIEDASKAPKGPLRTGTSGWQEDIVEALVPELATVVEVRVVICGAGKVWIKNVMYIG